MIALVVAAQAELNLNCQTSSVLCKNITHFVNVAMKYISVGCKQWYLIQAFTGIVFTKFTETYFCPCLNQVTSITSATHKFNKYD